MALLPRTGYEFTRTAAPEPEVPVEEPTMMQALVGRLPVNLAVPLAMVNPDFSVPFLRGSGVGNMTEAVIDSMRVRAGPDLDFINNFDKLAPLSPAFQQFPEAFSDVRNLAEFQEVESEVARRLEDQKAMNQYGLTAGFAAQLAQGVLSPTSLLPAGAALQGGKAVKVAAEAALWGVVATGIDSMVAVQVDPTFTKRDALINVGFGAGLGFMLGGLGKMVGPKVADEFMAEMSSGKPMTMRVESHIPEPISAKIDTLDPDMPDEVRQIILQAEEVIGPKGGSVGAARTGPDFFIQPSQGGLAPSFGLDKVLSYFDPVVAGLRSPFSFGRAITAQFESGSLLRTGAQGANETPLGTVSDRVQRHYGELAMVLNDYVGLYNKRADRAMSRVDFKREVTLSHLSGYNHPDPVVNEAAKAAQKVFLSYWKAGQELGMKSFTQVSPEKAAQYFTMSTRREVLVTNRLRAERILKQHSLEIFQDEWTKDMERLNKRQAQLDQRRADLSATPEEEAAIRADLEKQMAMLPFQFDDETKNIVAEIDFYRALAKEAQDQLVKSEYSNYAQDLAEANKEKLKPLYDAKRNLRRRFATLDKTKRALEERQRVMLGKIEEFANDQIDATAALVNQARKYLDKLDLFSEKDFRVGVKGLEKKLAGAIKVLNKAEKKISDLEVSDDIIHLVESDNTPTEKISILQAQIKDKLDEMEALRAELDDVATKAELTREQKISLVNRVYDNLLRTNALATFRKNIRLRNMIAKTNAINPEDTARELARIDRVRSEAGAKVRNKYEAQGIKFKGDVPNFDLSAQQHAQDIVSKMLMQHRKAPGVSMALEYGPLARKTLDIDPLKDWGEDGKWLEFLETDMEKVLARYVRTVAPDMEIYRVFGSVNPLRKSERGGDKFDSPMFNALYEEFNQMKNALPPGSEREAEKLTREYDKILTNMGVIIDRVRHMRGQPEAPEGFFYRSGQVIQNLNVLRYMGNPTVSSITDLSKYALRTGMLRLHGPAFEEYVAALKTIGMQKDQLQRGGVALDLYFHGNSTAFNDVMDEHVGRTSAEKLLRASTNRMGMVNLMDHWNTGNGLMAGVFGGVDLVHWISLVEKPGATESQLKVAYEELSKLGLGTNEARLIKANLDAPGGAHITPEGVVVPNTEVWNNQARLVYETALNRYVGNIVLGNYLGRPLAADANMIAKLFFQFQSFNFATNTKVLLALAQEVRGGNMAVPLTFITSSLALGMVAYYIASTIRGGRAQEEMQSADAAKWVDEAISRSGIFGYFGKLRDDISRSPINDVPVLGKLGSFSGGPISRGEPYAPDWFLSPFGPGVEAIARTFKTAGELGKASAVENDQTAKNSLARSVDLARGLMPYQNLWAVQIIDHIFAVEETIKDAIKQ